MKKTGILAFLILVFAAFVLIWWTNGTRAADPNDKKIYTFVVVKDEGVRSIANRLKKDDLIRDPTVFFILIKNFPLVGMGIDNKIQAGDHRISPSMSAREVAQNLTLATNDVWITIVEGQRAEEVGDALEADIPSFQDSWREELNENEGYLFPDTYLVPKDSTIEQVLLIFRSNFDTKYASIKNTDKSDFTKDEIITIASLVEREARHAEDRPLVASVILNRLSIGMKLDIDATVQYVLGFQENEKDWWKEALTFDDLDIKSPYNTYLNAGLPPTPIANPGLAAMSAVVTPAETDYLYYISDKEGVNHYAETLAEHNVNIEKYLK